MNFIKRLIACSFNRGEMYPDVEEVSVRNPREILNIDPKWMCDNGQACYVAFNNPEWMVTYKTGLMCILRPLYMMARHRFLIADEMPRIVFDAHPAWMAANRTDWMIKHRARYMAINYPEITFDKEPYTVSSENPVWALDNRFEWMVYNCTSCVYELRKIALERCYPDVLKEFLVTSSRYSQPKTESSVSDIIKRR